MSQIRDFILHLRLNYNFLILSAPFLIGALYTKYIDSITTFVSGFIFVYIFLFGGANAYNSYFDKDEGPIGGLEHPPGMKTWMYYWALLMQIIGVVGVLVLDFVSGVLTICSMLFSWAYSSPMVRLKSHPYLSFVAIGVGTVTNTVLIGYYIAGGQGLQIHVLLGAIGATCVVLSMYPFSQVYQMEEDAKRGDITFAIQYGIQGIRYNYLFLFITGIFLLSGSFYNKVTILYLFLILGSITYIIIWNVVKNIKGVKDEYKKVMKTKYYSGIAFTLATLLIMFLL
jgi:4-hydroxybenzoate polyprenyltransferase